MNKTVFYLSGYTAALQYAKQRLFCQGYEIVSQPSQEVTYLLLPVPSFDSDGNIKGGGAVADILKALSSDVVIIGGNLDIPALSGRKCMDLLQDAQYLAQNAAITADCAIRIAANNLPIVMDDCPILIVGWGRIGKCLAWKLKAMGADVTVAARKETDRAMAQSLGFHVRDSEKLSFGISHYRAIFNTVPAPILKEEQIAHCRDDCIKIDLASKQGIFCNDAIWARGLPNRDAPESSGILIAKTVLRLIGEKEASL